MSTNPNAAANDPPGPMDPALLRTNTFGSWTKQLSDQPPQQLEQQPCSQPSDGNCQRTVSDLMNRSDLLGSSASARPFFYTQASPGVYSLRYRAPPRPQTTTNWEQQQPRKPLRQSVPCPPYQRTRRTLWECFRSSRSRLQLDCRRRTYSRLRCETPSHRNDRHQMQTTNGHMPCPQDTSAVIAWPQKETPQM